MIALVAAGVCYAGFLLFETFALALDRLSPIKVRGLLEEHPERARILSGPGQVEIVRTTTKVFDAGAAPARPAHDRVGPRDAAGSAAVALGRALLPRRLDADRDRAHPQRRGPRPRDASSPACCPSSRRPRGSSCRSPTRSAGSSPARATSSEKPAEATEEEVQAYIDVGRQEGILEKDEEKLLLSIVDFGDTRVREVMTPRTDVVWIDVASSLTVLFDLFVESKYSRIPVVRGSIDTVLGVVHVKDTLEVLRAGAQRSHRGPDAGGLLRSGDQEGLGAAAGVSAAASLDGDRRRRVRRRLRPGDGRGPPRGDRRRDLRRARGRTRAGLQAWARACSRCRARPTSGSSGTSSAGARRRRSSPPSEGSSRAASATFRGPARPSRSRTCASRSKKPTAGGSTGSGSSRSRAFQPSALSSQPETVASAAG